MRRVLTFCFVAILLAVPATALAHELDHASPVPQPQSPVTQAQSGGPGARWEFQRSFSTGNLQSDLDFFKQGDEMFASVGTFAAGGNGGQSIFRITQDGGKTVNPSVVSNHPSASCAPGTGVTGLQHDVEATPKGVPAPGDVLFNTTSTAAAAVKADTQLLIDATDAAGRCHDNGTLGQQAPRGGLEFIDVANRDQSQEGSVSKPNEIALTSHIGESHTVNVDPKRPHIAYSVTSDSVGVNAEGKRANEGLSVTGGPVFSLDGFEVVDFRSCLEAPLGTVPAGATSAQKRELCKPQVFRYRYPTTAMALGHTLKNQVFGCHELEIYADDRLTCGSGGAAIVLDMKGAFDDNGTPTNFTDDSPRGTPLPCAVRESSSINAPPGLKTGAKVFDCVNGEVNGQRKSLTVESYPEGNTSLQGVRYLGSATHVGRASAEGAATTRPSDQDIDFNHETEFTESGRFLLATDERGGGILPPGATCAQGADNPQGNGGVHAYRVDALRNNDRDGVPTVAEADEQYARTSDGKKAIYRAPIRTVAEETECTAHVLQQVPGQNRIFMGWYSQGTQVVDFTENADGTIDFKEAGFFIPQNANQWVSHVYRSQENPDGTVTYFGTAGDFQLSNGRNAVDFFKVTLPAPPSPRVAQRPQQQQPGGSAPRACAANAGFRSVAARPSRGGGLDIAFTQRTGNPVDVDIFQQSRGRRVVGERLVARFTGVQSAFRWSGKANRRGRKVTDGYYIVRYRTSTGGSSRDIRRLALRRVGGRFGNRPDYYGREGCGTIQSAKLERPVFGGRRNGDLGIAFRLLRSASVDVEVRRGNRLVRRYRLGRPRLSTTRRLRFDAEGRPRGDYRVRIIARRNGQTVVRTLVARRL